MVSELEKFLVLMSMHEISYKKQEELLDTVKPLSLDKVFENPNGILSTEEVIKIAADFDETTFVASIENMKNSGIEILTIESEDYPESLINLPERPLILYAKGDLSLLKKDCFSIVGTRMPSSYGKIVTERFAKELAESGFVIVSGLCYGVDQISHRMALDAGGKTIAVVASGFNKIYPQTNFVLAQEIVEKGLLLSEYPPSFSAKKYTFPRRNRIIAGLGKGVLITEAAFKSGTTHTKEFALEYGRDVFAVPGNITSEKSQLTNHIIKTAQGECVLEPKDILEFYGMEAKAKKTKVETLSFDEKAIVDLLEGEPRDFDYLAKKSNIPVNILNSCLTTLEIRGLIRKLPAQMYALI